MHFLLLSSVLSVLQVLHTEILSFSSSLKCASPWNLEFFQFTQVCFALKSWVFPVHSNFVFRSPEKLKISGLSTLFVHWKNYRFQCSAPRFTDKTEGRNQKCMKNNRKLRLFNAFVFQAVQNILWAENGHKLFFPSHFPSSKYFLCYRKTMQWATWCFLKFFWHFWLWAYSFLSEPGCWTLKSWVFWVNEKRSLSEPKKLKISVWSIQVNWENCKGTSKNKRKTEENSGGCSLHCFPAA